MRWLIALPFERPEHMGMDFAAELTTMGHDVRTFAYRRDNPLYKNRSTKSSYQAWIARRLVAACTDWQPDVVLVIKGGPISASVVTDIKRRTGAATVNVYPDSPMWIDDFTQVEAYDFFFIKDRYMLAAFEMAGLRNVRYLPTYCVPAFHYPVTPTEQERKEIGEAVALVGSHYPYREQLLKELIDFPVRVWGPGWRRCRDPRVRALVAGSTVWGRAKLGVYSAARLSLNPHHPLDVAGVNTRTFELAAAGACQLVDAKEDLATLFKPGEEVVAFHDLAELRRELRYYLAHPDEARAIGTNARRRALAEHTVRHRIDEILGVLDERAGIRP
jgi:spore maturation protein CgeB